MDAHAHQRQALMDELRALEEEERGLNAMSEKSVCAQTLADMGKAHLRPLLDMALMSIEDLARLKSENGRLNGALRAACKPATRTQRC